MQQTRTAARSCRTRKRAFHFYSPVVVRRSQAAARCGAARAGTFVWRAAAAACIALDNRQFAD